MVRWRCYQTDQLVVGPESSWVPRGAAWSRLTIASEAGRNSLEVSASGQSALKQTAREYGAGLYCVWRRCVIFDCVRILLICDIGTSVWLLICFILFQVASRGRMPKRASLVVPLTTRMQIKYAGCSKLLNYSLLNVWTTYSFLVLFAQLVRYAFDVVPCHVHANPWCSSSQPSGSATVLDLHCVCDGQQLGMDSIRSY